MLLRKPERYRFDPGRVLSPEERVAVDEAVTPILEIKARTCKIEPNNYRCEDRGGRWK